MKREFNVKIVCQSEEGESIIKIFNQSKESFEKIMSQFKEDYEEGNFDDHYLSYLERNDILWKFTKSNKYSFTVYI